MWDWENVSGNALSCPARGIAMRAGPIGSGVRGLGRGAAAREQPVVSNAPEASRGDVGGEARDKGAKRQAHDAIGSAVAVVAVIERDALGGGIEAADP